MPIGFHTRAWRAFSVAALAVAVAGCASLRSTPPPPAPPPLDTTESGSARTYLSLAELREGGADWVGAQAVVDKALAQQPASRALLLRRAELLLQRAEDEDAPELREQARAILERFTETSDAESRAVSAWLDFDDGRRDDALAAVHAAADTDPTSSRVQQILAHLLFRNGDYRGARNAAERTVELAPRSGAALRLRARTRVAVADVTGGSADAREVLRMHRDDPEASAILADALLRQADTKAAQRTLAGVPRERRNSRVLVSLARLEVGAGHAEAGRALLEEAIASHPNDAQVHEALVALDIREGRPDDSAARLAAAVAARPDDAALQRLHAQALGAARRDDEAGASFARSLALDPNEITTYRALVEWLSMRTQSNETERRAAELGLSAGPTLVAIGLLREARNDRSGARAHFQKALEADPNLAVARGALAASFAANGEQLELALTLAREARAARPRDPAIADTLGLVHLRRGQGSAALEVLGEAAGTHPVWSPGYAETLYHCAMALETMRETENARRTVEVALAAVADRKPEPAWVANARAVLARSQPAPVARRETEPPAMRDPTPAPNEAPNAEPTPPPTP
jgi:tetratricopeptide (TPR) repeat protein